MRVVFMGTPDFAATVLEELAQHHEVVGVYTRPDAVRGRGSALVASPVKACAERFGIPVFTPVSFADAETFSQLEALQPECICVAAYGLILPKNVLDLPPYGCLNVHPSLLPRWRGAAPVERAILHGDAETGVCIMRMEEGLDTGPFCICRTAQVGQLSASELSDELANLGAQSLLTALIHVEAGRASWTSQDESLVRYADKIGKHELDVSPDDYAVTAVRKVQASGSAHAARCVIAGRPVSLLEIRKVSGDDPAVRGLHDLNPGEVRYVQKRLFLGAAVGVIEVLELRPDGKHDMDAKAFAAGIHGIKTDVLHWSAPHAS